MSQSKVIFTYKDIQTIIPCCENEKIRNILVKYASMIRIDINKAYFLYNGNKVNEELSFEELATEEDKLNKEINIILY